ncbi:lipocalin family protein [Formosa sp. 4Alg 33]|uniref:lipocalin family protein n=1 Tax=Formosa sp. 4Alg 33 TaxID=3382189 RepID=UPI003D9C5DEF
MKNFKRVIILTVTVLAFMFSTSCSSDDGAPNENTLVGTWKEISVQQKEYLNGDLISDTITSPEADDVVLITLRSDNTFTSNSNTLGEVSSGTYSIDGNTIAIIEDDLDMDAQQVETTYEVTGDTLYLTGEQEVSYNETSYKFEFKMTLLRQ